MKKGKVSSEILVAIENLRLLGLIEISDDSEYVTLTKKGFDYLYELKPRLVKIKFPQKFP